MKLYKENKLSGEHEVTVEQAVEGFWKSEQADVWRTGEVLFERQFVSWLSQAHGSWDPEEQREDYEALLNAVWDGRPS